MEEKKIFVCSKCGAVGSTVNASYTCPRCGTEATATGFNASLWAGLSSEERIKEIEKISPIKERISVNSETYGKSIMNSSQYSSEALSPWITVLKAVTIIWLCIGGLGALISGIVLMSNDSVGVGLAILVGGLIFAFITAAISMVFLDLASDVRKMRIMFENRN